MNKKKILIAHNYNTESFASMSYYLAHFLIENGHNVTFYSHKHTKFCELTGLNVISCKYPQHRISLNLVYNVIKILIKSKPNIIIGHFGRGKLFILLSKLFLKVQTYYYYHTLIEQQNIDGKVRKIAFYREKLFRKYIVDINLPNSSKAHAELLSHWNCKNSIKHLTPIPDRLKQNDILKIRSNSSKMKIGFLGRLEYSKGYQLLIELVEKYPEILNDLDIFIAGTGSNEVINKIQLSGLKYKGFLRYNEIDCFIQSMDAIIIPSISDNLVTVGIEALMNGKVLLISKNTGLTMELEHRKNAIIFEPNLEGLISVISEFLYLNDDDLKEIENNARLTYKSKFSISGYNNFMLKLIENHNA